MDQNKRGRLEEKDRVSGVHIEKERERERERNRQSLDYLTEQSGLPP